MINLSQDFSIQSHVYANQGNSAIGIRGSGKTHTATKIAEDLMTDGIPIVVFDPSGVWHNLRYGKDNQPGFPIVVAGGLTPDLELTELNCLKILEAAMKENVSIIFDLSEMESKAKEVKIVADCIEYIMQYNKTLRHIFIEEAAEYCPERKFPNIMRCYGIIERMARIGRNKGIGFTLINQRSQEIAKAIFELCDRVFIHRQTGKNSLNVIDSWFKYKGIEDKNDIVKALPKLNPGECWVIDIDGEHFIKVLPKKTFHPDPQNNLMVAPEKSKTDVSHFITKMSELIRSMEEEKKIEKASKIIDDQAVPKLKAENYDLTNTIQLINRRIDEQKTYIQNLESRLSKISQLATGEIIEFEKPVEISGEAINKFQSANKKSIEKNQVPIANDKIPPGAMRMLEISSTFSPKSISKKLLVLHSGISPKSSNVANYISLLKREGFITVDGNQISITTNGLQQIGSAPNERKTKERLIDFWFNFIGPGKIPAKIFQYLSDQYPDSRDRTDIIAAVGISEKSSSFQSAISDLKGYGLIEANGKEFKVTAELFQ